MSAVARVTLLWRVLALLAALLSLIGRGECSQEVMHSITKGFIGVLEDCKTEENVGDHVMKDFFNFWHEEYDLVNREMGCVMLCMANKLKVVDGDFKMHHDYAHEFAKSHGADDELAKQLVSMVHECEKSSESVEERCARALETTKCFRSKIHGLKWAPSMKVIMEEVMASM